MVMEIISTGLLMVWILVILLMRSWKQEESRITHIIIIIIIGIAIMKCIHHCQLLGTASIIKLKSTVLPGLTVTIQVQLQN